MTSNGNVGAEMENVILSHISRREIMMKILTKKQVSEILKRITANEIICVEYMKDIDAHTHLIENNAEIAYLVGGIKGMNKIQNTLKERYQPKGENDENN